MGNGSLWSNLAFENEVISYSNNKRLQVETVLLGISEHTNLCNKGVFSFIVLLQLRWPVEFKFSQVCYFMHILRYTKCEYWSLTITKRVKCLYRLGIILVWGPFDAFNHNVVINADIIVNVKIMWYEPTFRNSKTVVAIQNDWWDWRRTRSDGRVWWF